MERGLGYVPVEAGQDEGRLPIGTIALDAIFTPVEHVNYTVEDMRVGDRTDYNRCGSRSTTDGTVSPSAALHKAANILKDHFEKVAAVAVQEFEQNPKEPRSRKKKAAKKKKDK